MATFIEQEMQTKQCVTHILTDNSTVREEVVAGRQK